VIASPNQFDFEIPDEPFILEEKPRKGLSDTSWNRMTLVFFIATIMTAILMVSIFLQPNSGLNPFPPVVIPPTVIIPSVIPTEQVTFTPLPPTEVFVLPSATVTGGTVWPTSKVTNSAYSFVVQPGSPANVSSSIMRPDDGCNWLGIGGQVVDMQGAPIVGLRVQLYGSFHGKIKTVTSLTGTVDRYGPAGYELTIADYPSATTHTLWVQLFNQSGGALSDKVYFDTFTGCEKNLIIIHFKQVK
jgi:hypothetical protein